MTRNIHHLPIFHILQQILLQLLTRIIILPHPSLRRPQTRMHTPNPIQVPLTSIISEHEPPGGQALPPNGHARVHLTRRFSMQLVRDGYVGPVEVVEPLVKVRGR